MALLCARKSKTCIIVHEERIPLKPEVEAASRMLGIDPYTVANEGKAVIWDRNDKAEKLLSEAGKESWNSLWETLCREFADINNLFFTISDFTLFSHNRI